MRKKSRSKITNSLFIVAALVLLIGGSIAWAQRRTNTPVAVQTGLIQTDESAAPDEVKPQVDEYSVAADLPKYLVIESLKIKSRVITLGVNSDNRMQSPANIHDTGWYNKSAKPGNVTGTMLMDGHVGGPNEDGVFHDLHKLKPGDAIEVVKGDNASVRYVVRTTETKDVNQVDMSKMLQPVTAGRGGLNLITCAGDYNKDTRQYNERFMVYAERTDAN